jgi:serine/threonine-protein kinase
LLEETHLADPGAADPAATVAATAGVDLDPGATVDLTRTPGEGAGDPDATNLMTRSGQTVFDLPSEGAQQGSGTETWSDADLANLRYRILRLHAKGGLGQVFIARDEELNREVALKEIQGKHAHHDESRIRFLIEAEVTGGLEHPGIVPVYGLGRYPDGRPFYAMRFIRGVSLRETIKAFHRADREPGRDPGQRALELRKLLGQLVDVCNAVAYAHSRGVLHRDLKPENIMLGDFGETLVVDWGLAKFQDVPEGARAGSGNLLRPLSAGSSSRTLYGSAVGTPQYMSPEQAAGELDRLGPPSDVYALGAILYTVLTGEPPYVGRELAPLLYKVSQGDFRPPREVNRRVDPALNAVCLKAMARKPEDRYPTASALAEDLEHWMADEPVSVYREPLARRAARWARRHKTAVAAAAALLVTGLISLGIYSELIRREKARTERFYGLARLAVDRMLTKLGEEGLADTPQMELVRREMLDQAGRFYQTLHNERGDDPRTRADVSMSAVRLGDVETLIGEDAKAEGHYGEAIAGLTALRARDGADRALRRDLARAYHARGLLLRKLNRADEAERDLREALKLRDDLARGAGASEDDRRARTDTLYFLAALHAKAGRDEVARLEYDQAIQAQEALAGSPAGTVDDRRRLGRYLNNLANLLREKLGMLAEATAVYRKALEVQEAVVALRPAVAFYRYELAKTNGNLYTILGGGPPAKKYATRELQLAQRLVRDFPRVPDYRCVVATSESNVGKLLFLDQQSGEALPKMDKAIEIAGRLVRDFPERVEYREVLAASLLNRGALALANDQLTKAEPDLVQAVETLKPVVSRKEPPPEDVLTLVFALNNLAQVHRKLDQKDRALKDFDDTIAALEPLARDHPDRREYQSALATALYNRGKLLQDTGQFERSEGDLFRAVAKFKELTSAKDATVAELRDFGTALTNLALLRQQLRRPDDALRDFDRAVSVLEPLAHGPSVRRDVRGPLAKSLLQRGLAQFAAERLGKAESDFRKTSEYLTPLASSSDAVPDDLRDLGDAYFNLAQVHARLKRPDDALATLEQAIGVHERLGNGPGGGIPPLWRDLKLKCQWLEQRGDHLEIARVAERLPALRPDDPGSYVHAARTLAFCTFPTTLGVKREDDAFEGLSRGYADRAMKILSEASRRGFIGPDELEQKVYDVMRGRDDFRRLHDDLKRKARSRADAPRPTPSDIALRSPGGQSAVTVGR